VHDRPGTSLSIGADGRRPDIIGNGNDVSAQLTGHISEPSGPSTPAWSIAGQRDFNGDGQVVTRE
jgi:hypothetical protein